jgi:hypothetical protein
MHSITVAWLPQSRCAHANSLSTLCQTFSPSAGDEPRVHLCQAEAVPCLLPTCQQALARQPARRQLSVAAASADCRLEAAVAAAAWLGRTSLVWPAVARYGMIDCRSEMYAPPRLIKCIRHGQHLSALLHADLLCPLRTERELSKKTRRRPPLCWKHHGGQGHQLGRERLEQRAAHATQRVAGPRAWGTASGGQLTSLSPWRAPRRKREAGACLGALSTAAGCVAATAAAAVPGAAASMRSLLQPHCSKTHLHLLL